MPRKKRPRDTAVDLPQYVFPISTRNGVLYYYYQVGRNTAAQGPRIPAREGISLPGILGRISGRAGQGIGSDRQHGQCSDRRISDLSSFDAVGLRLRSLSTCSRHS
jgi:hypothetical protein